jgi:hypothetical protein
MAEGEPFAFMERLATQADFGPDAQIITLDGLRVEFPHGWGLVRASNTTPSLVAAVRGGPCVRHDRYSGAISPATVGVASGFNVTLLAVPNSFH